MSYIEFIAAAIAAIFIIIEAAKKALPWLASAGSKYIPLITLALGVGVAIYSHYEYGINAIEALITAVIPMIASSGTHSVYGTAKNL
ncbi:MAG: hypothetical protein PHQ43_15600 [Dehalococcoidales bacterium]|nr:hypothetical protein [Dehalococcoidales bacterium]